MENVNTRPRKVGMSHKERIFRENATDLHTLVAEQAELNEAELLFREYYRQHPGDISEDPVDLCTAERHITAVLRNRMPDLRDRLLSDSLDEDKFFDFDMDAVIYRHLRYLPAFWHSHDFFEVMCVFWGTCVNHLDGQTLVMKPGDVCILRPNTRHAVSAFSDDCVIFNIELRKSTFEEAFFSTLEDADILSAFFHHSLYRSNHFPYLLFRTGEDFELYDYLLYAVNEFGQNRLLKRRMLNNIIMAFFIMLLRKHGSDVIIPDLETRESSESAFYMLLYMQEHFTTLSLSELAQFFNYSERQVQRLIRSLTGKSYLENIKDLKMQHAARMLDVSRHTVTQIAQDLGYSDMANFRKIFRDYYGVNPAEYRENKGSKKGGR